MYSSDYFSSQPHSIFYSDSLHLSRSLTCGHNMASKMGKRFTGVFSRSRSTTPTPTPQHSQPPVLTSQPDGSAQTGSADLDYISDTTTPDSPEANISRNIRLFCESGSASNGGEEVLHLPVIVDAAESSPAAAAAAAKQIRYFMGREWALKPHVQYNAIMLIRILSDNPGASFTKNFDKGFVSTIKEALKGCKDVATQQILRETLDTLEVNKSQQEGMEGLIAMWRKEKGQGASFGGPGGRGVAPHYGYASGYGYNQPNVGVSEQRPGPGNRGYSARSTQLPPPVELASRIEESRNTAKILLQLVQSTPSEDLLNNDLLREFADRCQSAQKSMAGYIACDNPHPDDETMLTLIETNEQLTLATSRYQRSLLNARKALGLSPSPQPEARQDSGASVNAPVDSAFGQQPSAFSPPQSYAVPVTNTGAFGSAGGEYKSPAGPPPRVQSPQQRALSDEEETYAPPAGPPPRQQTQQSAFSNNSQTSYSPPRRDWSQQPNGASTQLQPTRSPDPFADPFFSDPADQNHTSTTLQPNRNPYVNVLSSSPNRAQTSELTTSTSPVEAEMDDPYSASPTHSRSNTGFDEGTNASSQRRWQDLRATASYMGRQDSAANGLTMRGAQPSGQDGGEVAEIDEYSRVERV